MNIIGASLQYLPFCEMLTRSQKECLEKNIWYSSQQQLSTLSLGYRFSVNNRVTHLYSATCYLCMCVCELVILNLYRHCYKFSLISMRGPMLTDILICMQICVSASVSNSCIVLIQSQVPVLLTHLILLFIVSGCVLWCFQSLLALFRNIN